MLSNRHTHTQTDTHTDTQTKSCNPRCVCAPRVNNGLYYYGLTVYLLAVTFRLLELKQTLKVCTFSHSGQICNPVCTCTLLKLHCDLEVGCIYAALQISSLVSVLCREPHIIAFFYLIILFPNSFLIAHYSLNKRLLFFHFQQSVSNQWKIIQHSIQ